MCHNPNGLWQKVAIKPFIKGRLVIIYVMVNGKNLGSKSLFSL